MATRAIRIVDEYATSDIKGRIDIILENYPNFLEIMDGYEESLKFLIINERKAARRRNMGELGARVQTSRISDKTANEAIESAMLSEELNTSYEGVKSRLKRGCNRIRKTTAVYLEKKYNLN